MSPLRRLWNVMRRARMDDDLRLELDTHLALIEEEERARGSSFEEARRRARSRFGNALAYREQALDAVIATWLENACADVTFAARRLVRSPTFTLASVLTLALAIGANVSVFAVVQRVVLNPLPYPDSDRLIVLDHATGLEGVARSGPAPWMAPGLYYITRSSIGCPRSRASQQPPRRTACPSQTKATVTATCCRCEVETFGTVRFRRPRCSARWQAATSRQ